MITWKLWSWLRRPMFAHPVFQRAERRQQPLPPEVKRYIGIIGLGLCALSVLNPGILTSLLFLALTVPFFYLIFNGTCYGAIWAARISDAITLEHEQGTHDLLCTAPMGTLGVHWLIGTGSLHRQHSLTQAHAILRALLIISVVTLAIIVAIITFQVDPARTNRLYQMERRQAFLALVSIAFILGAVYFDHIQSTILGSLIGMLTPTYVHSRLDSRIWSIMVFLALQMGIYVVFWLLGIVLTDIIFSNLRMMMPYGELALTLIRVIIFYTIRDRALAITWRLLVDGLNADPNELDLIYNLNATMTKAAAK